MKKIIGISLMVALFFLCGCESDFGVKAITENMTDLGYDVESVSPNEDMNEKWGENYRFYDVAVTTDMSEDDLWNLFDGDDYYYDKLFKYFYEDEEASDSICYETNIVKINGHNYDLSFEGGDATSSIIVKRDGEVFWSEVFYDDIDEISATYFGDTEVGVEINKESDIEVVAKEGETEVKVRGWEIKNPGKLHEGKNEFTIEFRGFSCSLEIEVISEPEIEDDFIYNDQNETNSSTDTTDRWLVTTDSDAKNICWSLAQAAVKQKLKVPKSAKFPFSYNSEDVLIKDNGEGMYEVTSRVRAKNSFGVEVTNIFIVQIEKDGSNFVVKSCWFPNL